MDSFKRINEEKLPDKKCFYSLEKLIIMVKTNDNGDGRIMREDYLTCNKIWDEFSIKNMGD